MDHTGKLTRLIKTIVLCAVLFGLVFPAGMAFADDNAPTQAPETTVSETSVGEVTPEETATPEATPQPEGESASSSDEQDNSADVPEEQVSDIIDTILDADVVVTSADGEVLSFASQDVVSAVAAGDPYIVRGGVTYRFLPTGQCAAFGGVSATCFESATPVQDAVNFAIAGEEINILAGNYAEDVIINKASLKLTGISGNAYVSSFSLFSDLSSINSVFAPLVNVYIGGSIQDGITLVQSGGTVNVGEGSFLGNLEIAKSMVLKGAGESKTHIIPTNNDTYGIYAHSTNDITLRDFSLDRGVTVSTVVGVPSRGSYGLKISSDGSPKISNIVVDHVSVMGPGRTGVDLNGVNGAAISNVYVNGTTYGTGIALTDVDNATLSNLTTLNNAWGGLAVYARGAYAPGGSNNVILSGTNSFSEYNKLYVQNEGGYKVTNFTANGFEYATGNLSTLPGYLFYTQDLAEAVSRSLINPVASRSWIRDLNAGKVEGSSLFVVPGMTIQAAIDEANPLETINVMPGLYSETATNRFVNGSNGPYQFGLFISNGKQGIVLQGLKADGTPATKFEDAAVYVTTNATNNFGYSGIFVEGDDVTMSGLVIGDNAAGNNKTIEVIGNNFTFKNNQVVVSDGGSIYFNDWNFNKTTDTSHVQSYTIDGNYFGNGSSVDLTSGAGYSGSVSSRKIINNTFDGFIPQLGDANWALISFNGSGTSVPWFVQSVGGAIITGNTFSNSTQYIRARGDYENNQFDWQSYWCDNLFENGVITLSDVPNFTVREYTYNGSYGPFMHVRRIGGDLVAEEGVAQDGDVILTAELCEELGICVPDEPVDPIKPVDPIVAPVIPVTGGLQSLSCTASDTLVLPDGKQVTFLGILCEYSGALVAEASESMPAPLPTGMQFVDALTVSLFKENAPVVELPEGIKAVIQFPAALLDAQKNYGIVRWDPTANNGLGEWVEVPGAMFDNNFFVVQSDVTGTFVLIEK